MRTLIKFRNLILLSLILLVALFIRIYGINFGLPGLFHPDENIFVEGALRVASGNLEPITLRHGSFTHYLLASFYGLFFLLQKAMGVVNTPMEFLLKNYVIDPKYLFLSGRLLIAFLGVVGVALTYCLGKRLFGNRTGVISALLLSFSYIHVQQSHFIKEDIVASLLLLISFLFFSRLLNGQSSYNKSSNLYSYTLGGFFLGLAIATKYTSCAGVAFLFVFCIFGIKPQNFLTFFLDKRLFIAIAFMVIGFALGEPFALINFKGLLRDVIGTAGSPELGLDKGWQPTWLFYLTEHLKNGVGLYVEIAIFAGLILALRNHFKKALSLLSFPLCLLIILNLYKPHAGYYLLPALPFLVIFAGLLVDQLLLCIRLRLVKTLCCVFLLTLYLLTSFMDCFRFGFLLSRPDTRNQAEKWITDNISDDAKILVEGSYGSIIAGGPPLKSSLDTLNRELKLVKEKGGAGLIWQARKKHIQENESSKKYDLYKVVNLTSEDIINVGPDYVIVSGYYNYPTGYLLMSLDERDNVLKLLKQNYVLLKQFSPFPNMDSSPYLVLMDFNRLRKMPIFGRQKNKVIQGPTIEIYERI